MPHCTHRLFAGAFAIIVWTLLMNNCSVNGDNMDHHLRRSAEPESICEPVNIPMCRDVAWKFTMMPNVFNHDSQEEAGMEAHQFWPLVKVGCSSDLTVFLCSMYVPVCMEDYRKPLPPCRSLCERARHGCAPTMAEYGFNWPEKMDCETLPDYGDENDLCMDPGNGSAPVPTTPKPATAPPSDLTEWSATPIPDPKEPKDRCACSCPSPALMLPSTSDRTNVHFGGVEGCAAACRSPLASSQEMELGQYWITGWAILCCLCTAFTLMTYVIDTTRFKYPERPIVFIALCYLMVSVGFLIRVIVGHENVACNGEVSLQNTVNSGLCTTVFLLLYFFGMASCIWWVILAVNWFMAAGLRLTTEAIAGHSTKFHLFAWSIPCIQSIIILVTKAVDGDPIAGVCYVGQHSLFNLKVYVLGPYCAYLVIGVGFLLAGFCAMKSIRRAITEQTRADREKRETLKRLMRRIAIFSLCTFLPNAALVGCYVYELNNRQDWEEEVTCSCKKSVVPKPLFAVFMLKYLCMLVVGITSGVWLIGRKTVEAWRTFLCGKCVQPYSTKSSECTTMIMAPPSIIRSHRSHQSPYPPHGSHV
ncbi:Frizzled-8 [Hypsibius exemplaris]|uniref:Frizzled-8 n=1 Tax=Hypsibius exemplaris TaxID=2072580 RepID=A0A1W0X6Y9_HYPEX|nr:Frizzled-8 [Hypsibius exemplaris]